MITLPQKCEDSQRIRDKRIESDTTFGFGNYTLSFLIQPTRLTDGATTQFPDFSPVFNFAGITTVQLVGKNVYISLLGT